MLSIMEYCLTAEMMPIGTPITSAKRQLKNASLMVAGNRSNMAVAAGCRVEYEVPRSP